MSKPQVAAEPTLEEILASIRKMISDDKPGPSPVPDQMGRTPFGESLARSASQSEARPRTQGETAGPARGGPVGAPGFNSLSDALKVATTLSDQRRSLQQEVASALDKTPRSNLDALTELSSARAEASRPLPEGRAGSTNEQGGLRLPNPLDRASEPLTPAGEGKRDLLSFDFGTLVPQRDDLKAQSPATSTTSPASETPAAKADPKTDQSSESRVLQLRSSTPNVAPFPRPLREATKTTDAEIAAKTSETSAKREAETVEPETAVATPSKEVATIKSDALALHGEALLDAVVDLVQQQPSSLSVFTSGASFISGVAGAAKAAAETKAGEAKTSEAKPAAALPAPAAGTPDAPQQKIDRDAAELLRPMLRQWLAENMGRILEEALRSELTDQTGKDPKKT